MTRRRKRPAEANGINLTPVLGLAFILLLFVVAAVPFAQERGIDFGGWWDAICECGPAHGGPLIVTVDSRNRIFVGEGDARKQLDIRIVKTVVARWLAEFPKSSVLVEAHPHSDMGIVIRVVDQAKQARNPPPPVQIAAMD